jgi:hypothetical protein
VQNMFSCHSQYAPYSCLISSKTVAFTASDKRDTARVCPNTLLILKKLIVEVFVLYGAVQ